MESAGRKVFRPTIHAIVVTYRRPDLVRATVLAYLGQTHPPTTWTVVDNSPTAALERWALSLPGSCYLPLDANVGPAGGIAAGMRSVLDRSSDDDLVLLVDDGDPPPQQDALERLLDVHCRHRSDPKFAGTGLTGARFDMSRAILQRVLDEELDGDVAVDYIGGGQMPTYRVAAIRAVGVFDERLFFGSEELEFGLRLKSHGWSLRVDSNVVRFVRSLHGREGLGRRVGGSGLPPWRRYYSARNLLLVSHAYCGSRATLTAAARSGVGAATRAVFRRHWKEAAMACVGTWHGLRGVSGRVYTP